MNLVKTVDEQSKYYACDTIVVSGGRHLKIETGPDGVEVLDEAVPEGKVWEARILVNIVETQGD